MAELHTPGIAILVSGRGAIAEAVIEATQTNILDAEVRLLVCNKPPEEAGIYGRVDRLNKEYGLDIEITHISGATHPEGIQPRGQTLAESEAICQKVKQLGCAVVVCAGYIRVVNGDLISEYGWLPKYSRVEQARMMNSHPGLLPETTDTFGIHASKAALGLFREESIQETEYTVNLVAEGVDTGPIIARHPVKILPEDTPEELYTRVQAEERFRLPQVIGNFLLAQAEYHRRP